MSSELMFVHLTNIEASEPHRATPYVMGAQSRSVVVNPLSRVDTRSCTGRDGPGLSA